MRDLQELPYKTSRKAAGFTQLDVVELLGVADTTLSAYENGAKVPDNVVDKMCELYRDPQLAYWHLRHTYKFAQKYLPELTLISSGGEMAFQSIIARAKIDPIVEEITQIMSDGAVRVGEEDDWRQTLGVLREVTGRLLSVLLFSGKIDVDKEKAPTAAATVAGTPYIV